MSLVDVVTPENWHLHTMEDYVREVNEERRNLFSEIAGLRAKHSDYEHPQDSIDRGNRIDGLITENHNLQSQIYEKLDSIRKLTAQLAEAQAEVERLKEEIDGLNRDIGIIERGK